LTATPMAILFAVTGLSTETRADPPSWAPAHGWRRKSGTESEFTGKKNKNKAGRSRDRDDDDDDLDRQARIARRERELTRLERDDRQLRRQRELDRIDRESRLLDRDRALRERRRMLQLGLIP
jgi:hypothetical protein